MAGDHHDRRVAVAVLAHLRDELDAAQLGHALIDDDQHGLVFGRPLQRFHRGGEADRLGLGNLRNDLGEDRQIGLNVVDDEDFVRGGVGVRIHEIPAR